jgi:hypothetical protein
MCFKLIINVSIAGNINNNAIVRDESSKQISRKESSTGEIRKFVTSILREKSWKDLRASVAHNFSAVCPLGKLMMALKMFVRSQRRRYTDESQSRSGEKSLSPDILEKSKVDKKI